MPYLGNKPVNNFVSFAKQDITGNGGTSYSLDYPVTNANDIELFINNVRQEPTEAYSASGSTLTLTGAITSSDDVYAIFRGRALQTTTPAAGSVNASMLDTTSVDARYVNNTGDTMTGALVINAAGNDQFRLTDGTRNLYMDTDNNGVAIAGGAGQTLGGLYLYNSIGAVGLFTNNALRMTIDASGRVTMPYQPGCFVQFVGNAYTGSTGPMNVTSTSSPVTFYNDGSHFSFANAQFTAPVSGKYLVSILWYYGSGGSSYLGVAPAVNGTAYGMYWYNNASNYNDASVVNSRVVKVSASDQIGVQIYAASSDNNPDILFNVEYLG